MSLSKESIIHIENQAIALSHEKSLDDNTDFPHRLIPDSMKVESLEPFMSFRNHFRATMKTASINDFVKYFKDYEGSNCFINAPGMAAKTIFDLGDTAEPEHCHHKAILSLTKTAAYKAICNLNGNDFSQKSLADWLEEWHDFVTPLTDNADKEEMQMAKAIAAIRTLTIESKIKSDHETNNFSSRKTAMQEIEARSEDGLPGYFKFKCIPYEGLSERTFDLRMGIKTSHENPHFILRVMREESIEEELATEFQELLINELPKAAKTYIGSLKV